MTRILDAHCHIWPVTTEWLKGPGIPPILKRAYTFPQVQRAGVSHGVEQFICVQAQDGVAGDVEAEILIKIARNLKRVPKVVVYADLRHERIEAILEKYARTGVVAGVRMIAPQDEGVSVLRSSAFVRGVNTLAKLGLTFDFLVRPRGRREWTAVETFLEKVNPDLRLVLDHLMKPDTIDTGKPSRDWADVMAIAASRPNWKAKVSGLLTEANESTPFEKFFPFLDHALDCFQETGLIWGSDYPVNRTRGGYKRSIALIRAWMASRNLGERAAVKIFCTNAKRFYGIK